MAQAVLEDLIRIRKESDKLDKPLRPLPEPDGKWRHQEEAVKWFLADRDPKQNSAPMPAGKQGILAMATGTGKTRVACKIIGL